MRQPSCNYEEKAKVTREINQSVSPAKLMNDQLILKPTY